MAFGAEARDDGRVRFRLWAPGAERVTLLVEDRPRSLALDLAPEQQGWFGIRTEAAAHGSRYRFCIDGGAPVPDPASRFQPEDVHGPSEVIDPGRYAWTDTGWRGRPWHETVIYELHVGTFTPAGTFAGVERHLADIAALGATAIELMPVADFAGTRNWGYDGVLPFAPDSSYGCPDDLKHLVEAAHAHDLMVFLDVVYNHFGPEGNYMPRIAPAFFSERHHTPWGPAINYDGPACEDVRAFFVANALYWLEEYDLDGLRLDAVDTVIDASRPDIVEAIADRVRHATPADRHVHLMVENDRNDARYLERDDKGRPRLYDAQWNDDVHHAAHVLATAEDDGYYVDYAGQPVECLGRCLAEGFGYQGEPSRWRGGRARGTPSDHLPPGAFVAFLQNHDQVGNRAFGQRLHELASPDAVHALTAVLLLAPQPPLLFMGQEWAASTPFLFFCDFEAGLAERVARGRREEFAGFRTFRQPTARAAIPDPGSPATFRASVLDWQERDRAWHADWLERHRRLLAIRRERIVPRLAGTPGRAARFGTHGAHGLAVDWRLGDGSALHLRANLGAGTRPDMPPPPGQCILDLHASAGARGEFGPWAVGWWLDERPSAGETA